MRGVSLGLACVLTLVSMRAPAEGGETAPARLVQRLGSARYAEREAASRQLQALGEAALPALRQAARGSESEVRRRAEHLIPLIERHVEAARLLAGKRVRLNLKGATMQEAIRALTAQAGLAPEDVAFSEPIKSPATRVTLDTGEMTFWEALDRLCLAANLALQSAGIAGLSRFPYPDEAEVLTGDAAGAPVRLSDKPGRPLPTFRAGLLRLDVVLPPSWPGGARGEPAAGETGFVVEVRPEPRRLWSGAAAVRITRAVDDRGQMLRQVAAEVVGPPDPTLNTPGRVALWDGVSGQPTAPVSGFATLPVRLSPGKLPSARLKEVEGIVTVRLPTTRKLLVVNDVLQSQGTTVRDDSGRFATVLRVTRDAGAIEVCVRVQPQGGQGAAGFQVVRNRKGVLWVRGTDRSPLAEMALLDAKGNVLARTTKRALIPNPNGGLLLEFVVRCPLTPGAPEPARLVCSGPVVVSLDVPFTLRDVPVSANALPAVAISPGNPYMPAP